MLKIVFEIGDDFTTTYTNSDIQKFRVGHFKYEVTYSILNLS